MDTLQAVILALVQGLTEFLPISSSAHLILAPRLLGWQDQGLAFDVAVHVGTLIAVVFYFRHEVGRMLLAWLKSIGGGGVDADARLAWAAADGTLHIASVATGQLELTMSQEILDVAACCGFTFEPGLVAEVVGSDLIPALRQLAHLERSHRLVRSVGLVEADLDPVAELQPPSLERPRFGLDLGAVTVERLLDGENAVGVDGRPEEQDEAGDDHDGIGGSPHSGLIVLGNEVAAHLT